MLHKIANRTTNYLLTQQIIQHDMFEVYQYGLEILISTLMTSFSILIIACFMDSFWIGILYFIISVPLKVTVGGYHAPTYARCFVISNLEYLTISLAAKILSALFLSNIIWIISLLVSTCYILINCPIRNSNHPVSDSVLQKNRRFSFLFLGIDCSIIIALYFLWPQSYILNFMVLSIIAIALFILPVKMERRNIT